MDEKKEQQGKESRSQNLSLDYFEKTDVLSAPIENVEEIDIYENFKRNVQQPWSSTN